MYGSLSKKWLFLRWGGVLLAVVGILLHSTGGVPSSAVVLLAVGTVLIILGIALIILSIFKWCCPCCGRLLNRIPMGAFLAGQSFFCPKCGGRIDLE